MDVTIYASDVRDLHEEIMQRMNVRFEYGDEVFANSPAKKDEEHICAILKTDDVGSKHFEEGTLLDIMQGQQEQINRLTELVDKDGSIIVAQIKRDTKQRKTIETLVSQVKLLEDLTCKLQEDLKVQLYLKGSNKQLRALTEGDK